MKTHTTPTDHSVLELLTRIATLEQQLWVANTCAEEHIQAYKRSMAPVEKDAKRFVCLALAYLTNDQSFSKSFSPSQSTMPTVDGIRALVDQAARHIGVVI